MQHTETVYDFFLDTIKFEMAFGAYFIYLALKRGYVQKQSPVSALKTIKLTEQDETNLQAMMERDVLGLNRVKLFATAIAHKRYALYFAESVEHALKLHRELYGTSPTKWHSVYNQLQNISFTVGDKIIGQTFFELKQQIKTLPHYAGELEI